MAETTNPQRKTRRERLERRAERLESFAESRRTKAQERRGVAEATLDRIPEGQPILVGHHSERGHRRDLDRAYGALEKAREHEVKGGNMSTRAKGIRLQLATSIFSDDPDAIEQLEKRIASRTAKRDAMKAANAEYRRDHRAELKQMSAWDRDQAVPFPGWALRNLGADIRRLEKRLQELKRERDNGPTFREIVARFDSECVSCGAPLAKGQTIRYARAVGACCKECVAQ